MAPETKGRDAVPWVGAAVLWLVVCAAALCAAVLGVLSVKRARSPVEMENSCAALVIAQAFFVVFLWPLFERRVREESAAREIAWAVVRLGGLLALSCPLILVALRISEVSAAAIVRSQFLVALVGIAVAAAVRLPGAESWYYPAAFLLSAGVPLAAYLLREEGGVSATWAAAASPFWAAGALVGGWQASAPLIVFAGLACGAVAALFTVRVLRRARGCG